MSKLVSAVGVKRGFMGLGMRVLITAGILAVVIVGYGTIPSPATAHSSSCHTKHACPSDHHTYVWFDENGTGWSCARLGGDGYNPAIDTHIVNYGGYTYYCRPAGVSRPPTPAPSPPPPEPVEPPAEPETQPRKSKPTPLPVYMGSFGYAHLAMPRAARPPRLHPFSADNGAYFYGLRWSGWGEAKARARGKASVNPCMPACAFDRHVRRRGAKAVAYRLRKGDCNGEPARFYTRALMRFPKRYGIKAMTLKLKTGCI